MHVVLLVGLFIGMIVSLQTGLELSRIGQQDQIGTIVALSMAREMGPFITATILAATVGSALAAELGTMAVSEELAALEVMSIDRVRFLIVPRVVALAVMCPLLTILCDAIGIIGGGFVAESQLNVGLSALLRLGDRGAARDRRSARPAQGRLLGAVQVLRVRHGDGGDLLRRRAAGRGGALGVGNATRKAVRDSIIAIIISNYFMTWFFFQA